MRPNDYGFINSLAISVILWIVLVIALCLYNKSIIGLVYNFPVLYIFICIIIATTVIYQGRSFTIKEILVWIVI